MEDQGRSGKPKLTVMGSSEPPRSYGWQAIVDGTAELTIGGIVTGGFGIEAVKALVERKTEGLGWFLGGVLLGLVLVAIGLALRECARKSVRVGVIVAAHDSRSRLARARQIEQQAEEFSRSMCAVTMKVEAPLSAVDSWGRVPINDLVEETLTAISMAERLAPDASRVNLIPVMSPHLAFWFGARMGCSHAREVSLLAARLGSGAPAYLPAVSLRVSRQRSSPLSVGRLEVFDGGDQSAAALAIDVDGRGEQFIDHVRTACRNNSIGYLLIVTSVAPVFESGRSSCSDAVEQVYRAWADAPLPVRARTGHHHVFFSGSGSIAVAVGARLASVEYSRWSVFAFDEESHSYRPFPMLSGAAKGTSSVNGGERGESASSKAVSADGKKPRRASLVNPSNWSSSSALKLVAGDTVKHEKYGIDKVESVDGSGSRTTVTVDFGNSGTVRLMLIGSIPMIKVDP